MEPLKTSTIDAEEKSAGAQNLMEQPLSVEDENLVPENIPQDANNMDSSKDTSCHLGTLDGNGNCNAVSQNIVSAAQAQTVFYRGYDNATSEWEDYCRYINFESIETGSNGVYSEKPSFMFHTSYGYNPQIPPYRAYSPVTTPRPSASGDGQLYSQQFPFPGPYYQQTPPSMSYLTSPSSISPPDLTMPVEHQGAFLADTSKPNGMLFGPRPDYPLPYSYFGTESFAGNSGNPGLYDVRRGFDGFGSGGFWSDWLKSPEGAGCVNPFFSPAASPQPFGAFRSFGQGIGPLSSGVASEQQKSLYSFGSSPSFYERGYFHGRVYHQGSNFGGSGLFRAWESMGEVLWQLIKEEGGEKEMRLCVIAMVLLISSMSKIEGCEQLGQRTPAWNTICSMTRKLAILLLGLTVSCIIGQIFPLTTRMPSSLLSNLIVRIMFIRVLSMVFGPALPMGTVNGSAQFCGVAEMIGPVDFEKSVDYWQQDKWSGQFPVKWHIIKDVPNNLCRHIILENNGNKPVTNSRDTQEVKLDQGLEILSIFKKHEADMSILDDFDFYEERQKAMEERKACQQQLHSNSAHPDSSIVVDELQYSAPKSTDVMNQISKTFAQVVLLEESRAAESQVDKSSSSTSPAEAAAQPEDFRKPASLEVAHSS